jgi:uncharacterized protein
MKPVTLITGASAGIGTAMARVFAAHGHELVLVARRADRLNALADDIAKAGHPRPLVLASDLEQREAVAKIAAQLQLLDRNEQLGMVDLNVRALTELSLTFVDSLERHRGGLLNVASIAAFLPGPGMAVYYATKAYVLSFTEALHQEWAGRGIKVTALCPGPVPTEFQARAKLDLPNATKMIELPPDRVAQIGYDSLMRGQRVAVAGLGNKLAVCFMRFAPHALLLRAVDQRTGAGKGR